MAEYVAPTMKCIRQKLQPT